MVVSVSQFLVQQDFVSFQFDGRFLRWWQISFMASHGLLGIGFSSSWRANSTSVSSRRGGCCRKRNRFRWSESNMKPQYINGHKWSNVETGECWMFQSWNQNKPLLFICIAGRRMCCLLGSAHFYLLASLWPHSNVLSMPVPYRNISENWQPKVQVTRDRRSTSAPISQCKGI